MNYKPAVSFLLAVSIVFMSGCSGGTGTGGPLPINHIEQPASTNVVRNGDTYLIYVRGKLADTLAFGQDGSTTHTFANGKIVRIEGPRAGASHNHGRHVMTSAICAKLQNLLINERNQLAWDSAAVILALGATAAAAFFSFGVGSVAAVPTDALVLAAWTSADNALINTQNSYAAAGC